MKRRDLMNTIKHYLRLCRHIASQGYDLQTVGNGEPEDVTACRNKARKLEYAMFGTYSSQKEVHRIKHKESFLQANAEVAMRDESSLCRAQGAWINAMQDGWRTEDIVRVTEWSPGGLGLLTVKQNSLETVKWRIEDTIKAANGLVSHDKTHNTNSNLKEGTGYGKSEC